MGGGEELCGLDESSQSLLQHMAAGLLLCSTPEMKKDSPSETVSPRKVFCKFPLSWSLMLAIEKQLRQKQAPGAAPAPPPCSLRTSLYSLV